MKTFLFIIALFVLSNCNYSKGVKKDLTTGLTVKYNGFTFDDIYLADPSENRLDHNSFDLGAALMIKATDVDGFKIVNGKVFPACQIIITDKNKKELLHLQDAFTDMENGTAPEKAKVLRATVNTGSPMIQGDIYHLYVKFYDKNNIENEIVTNIDLIAKK